MNEEFGREIRIYEGKVYGCEVSKYGLGHWYLDYLTLSKIIGDCILNNTVRSETAETGIWLQESSIVQHFKITSFLKGEKYDSE